MESTSENQVGDVRNVTTSRTLPICALLFGSGLCALVYQTVWLREFRMIFGGSTPASAAVLAVFMAGLGAGGLALGRRVDKNPRPLRYYAILELLIAGSAALSPVLLWLASSTYFGLGGTVTLGGFLATILRLLLSAVVLGAPTFLMGGTLPAAARAIEHDEDAGRRNLALVYGANTLGAVAGVLLSTFYLLEQLGNRATLFVACAANAVVALTALLFARTLRSASVAARREEVAQDPAQEAAPVPFILVAAGASGFVFLLMELVWFRMMTPLLGGTTFTFGLILAIALFGIGLGGAAYSWFGTGRQPTVSGFALTCAAEALFIALPYALGDRLAVLALLLRPLRAVGFIGDIFGWTLVTGIVVFPAAVVAGIQFPLLIGLLGKGRRSVGSHTGVTYACNTVGAIAGSLAGGFGLIPALSATGVWKFCVLVLAIMGAAAWFFSFRGEGRLPRLLAPAALTLVAIGLLVATGPTAAWRQSPIGAGRADEQDVATHNKLQEWLSAARRYILLEEDGVESALGVSTKGSVTFLINGKADGNALHDAGTQVMSGLLGAILQPNARRSLVVGLGTGSTAGWLADVPQMERVDVVELERAVVKVAELCAPVNQNVLANPKIRVTIADARETLLTTPEKYDLIVSEPSNPYRAGVASLYTREYYKAANERLTDTGLFIQFVQSYEVDTATIRSIYATFCSVFPSVETWQTNETDLLFVGSRLPVRYDVAQLRQRIAEAPFNSAMTKVWRVTDLEGLLSHYVANDSFSREMARADKAVLNTDDRNLIEFGFARTVGKATAFKIPELREVAHERGEDRPAISGGEVDWRRVDDQHVAMDVHLGQQPIPAYSFFDADQRRRVEALSAYAAGRLPQALNAWRSQRRDPETLTEVAMMADVLAWAGDTTALSYIERIGQASSAEASLLRAFLGARLGRYTDAAMDLESAYISCRSDPWAMEVILKGSFDAAHLVASEDATGTLAARLYRALEQPFSVHKVEIQRRKILAMLAAVVDKNGFTDHTRKAIGVFEPHVPWEHDFLRTRRDCYRALGDARAATAERELQDFLAAEPQPLREVQSK